MALMFRTILGPLFLLCACGADAPLASKDASSTTEITIDGGDGESETPTDILGIVVTPDEVVLPVGSSRFCDGGVRLSQGFTGSKGRARPRGAIPSYVQPSLCAMRE